MTRALKGLNRPMRRPKARAGGSVARRPGSRSCPRGRSTSGKSLSTANPTLEVAVVGDGDTNLDILITVEKRQRESAMTCRPRTRSTATGFPPGTATSTWRWKTPAGSRNTYYLPDELTSVRGQDRRPQGAGQQCPGPSALMQPRRCHCARSANSRRGRVRKAWRTGLAQDRVMRILAAMTEAGGHCPTARRSRQGRTEPMAQASRDLRVMLVTTVKDEGPNILEWIGYSPDDRLHPTSSSSRTTVSTRPRAALRLRMIWA